MIEITGKNKSATTSLDNRPLFFENDAGAQKWISEKIKRFKWQNRQNGGYWNKKEMPIFSTKKI
jgi:hypothetical protein